MVSERLAQNGAETHLDFNEKKDAKTVQLCPLFTIKFNMLKKTDHKTVLIREYLTLYGVGLWHIWLPEVGGRTKRGLLEKFGRDSICPQTVPLNGYLLELYKNEFEKKFGHDLEGKIFF